MFGESVISETAQIKSGCACQTLSALEILIPPIATIGSLLYCLAQ